MLEYALKADKTTVVRDIRHELLTLGVTFMLKKIYGYIYRHLRHSANS
jgi:hypothetical protein